MSTEIAGGGQVTPAALRIMESGIRRVLAKVGALSGEPPPAAAATRIMQVRGQDYYVYAPDPGLFEPLVELGEEITAGTPAAIIHPHGERDNRPARCGQGRACR
jgi:predicted deacylase